MEDITIRIRKLEKPIKLDNKEFSHIGVRWFAQNPFNNEINESNAIVDFLNIEKNDNNLVNYVWNCELCLEHRMAEISELRKILNAVEENIENIEKWYNVHPR